MFSPATADRFLGEATAWGRAHQDRLIAGGCFVLGVYLVIKGVYELP